MKINCALFAVFVGTLFSCSRNGASLSTSFEIEAASSSIEWKGSAPDHFHTGAFDVSGTLTTDKHGTIKNGDFVIPISSIRDFDLEDPLREQLLTHLKSADFFNLLVYPNARFRITGVQSYKQADAAAISGANTLITGELTMIGQAHSLSFPARVTVAGNRIITEAVFNLNRLHWGMSSFSDPEQDLYILPDVALKLNIQAIKTTE